MNSPVAPEAGEITVDAEFVASGLGLSSEALKRLMRRGLLVAQFEIGRGDDKVVIDSLFAIDTALGGLSSRAMTQ